LPQSHGGMCRCPRAPLQLSRARRRGYLQAWHASPNRVFSLHCGLHVSEKVSCVWEICAHGLHCTALAIKRTWLKAGLPPVWPLLHAAFLKRHQESKNLKRVEKPQRVDKPRRVDKAQMRGWFGASAPHHLCGLSDTQEVALGAPPRHRSGAAFKLEWSPTCKGENQTQDAFARVRAHPAPEQEELISP